MELVTTHICKGKEVGVHGNIFGGILLSIIDEASGAYASQVCDTPRMVTVKIDELIFKKAVKVGNILKLYTNVKEFGTTSVTLYVELRKHNVYTGEQEIVLHTNIKFVRIDDEGNSIPISERVKKRYYDRVKKFGKGLLTEEERNTEKNQIN